MVLQTESFLLDLTMEFIVAFVGTLGGITLKSLYDYLKKRLRLRHMTNIFGPIDDLQGQVRFVLPRFKPLTYDDFAEGNKSFIVKDYIINESGTRLENRTVPLYSEILVIDDYLAFKKIDDLFTSFGYGTLEFSDDVNALPDWRKELIMCFGGPRSNQKLKQIMNLDGSDFISLADEGDLLGDWALTYKIGGESETFHATEEKAYSIIFKIQNPFYAEGKIFAIFGDSSYSTDMGARYLNEKLIMLSELFGNKDFLVILRSNRDMYETVTPVVQLPLEES